MNITAKHFEWSIRLEQYINTVNWPLMRVRSAATDKHQSAAWTLLSPFVCDWSDRQLDNLLEVNFTTSWICFQYPLLCIKPGCSPFSKSLEDAHTDIDRHVVLVPPHRWGRYCAFSSQLNKLNISETRSPQVCYYYTISEITIFLLYL